MIVKIFRAISPRWVLLLALAAGLAGLTGCASTADEPDNMSERPWNAPTGWENGLPGGMLDQQH